MTNETEQPMDALNSETEEQAVPETPQSDAVQPTVDESTPALEEAVEEATRTAGLPEAEAAGSAEPPPAEAPAPEDGGAVAAASEAPAKPQKPAGPPSRFTRGELVTGKLLSKSPLAITFDLGEGAVGEIMSRELERMAPQQLT